MIPTQTFTDHFLSSLIDWLSISPSLSDNNMVLFIQQSQHWPLPQHWSHSFQFIEFESSLPSLPYSHHVW